MNIIFFIMKCVVIVILLLLCGIALESLFRPKKSLDTLVYFLFEDISIIVNALFQVLIKAIKKVISGIIQYLKKQSQVSFCFGLNHLEEFREIATIYSQKGFNPTVVQTMTENGLPYIAIRYVPQVKNDDDILIVCQQYIEIKFKEILRRYSKDYPCFTFFNKIENEVFVYVVYREFEDQQQIYDEKRNEVIKSKTSVDYGVLYDDSLEQELKAYD